MPIHCHRMISSGSSIRPGQYVPSAWFRPGAHACAGTSISRTCAHASSLLRPAAAVAGAFEVLDKHSASRFLSDIDTLLFDCDGVLWKGSALIPGADEVRRLSDQCAVLLAMLTGHCCTVPHAGPA